MCGNLLEQSVEEAWQSAEMQRWRDMIPVDCHDCCAEFSQCHGGCRAMAMERGLGKDPLIGVPLIARQSPPQQISLYEGLRPVGAYQLREEEFGYALMRGNRIVALPHEAQAVLDLCDGRTTLKQIGVQFGQPGLDLVGALWEKGLLLLQD